MTGDPLVDVLLASRTKIGADRAGDTLSSACPGRHHPRAVELATKVSGYVTLRTRSK